MSDSVSLPQYDKWLFNKVDTEAIEVASMGVLLLLLLEGGDAEVTILTVSYTSLS